MFPTRDPVTVNAGHAVFVKARRSGKLTHVVIDPEDAGRVEHGQLFVNAAGFVRIKYPAWKASRFLADHLFSQWVRHKNGDRLDFRRANLEGLDPEHPFQ